MHALLIFIYWLHFALAQLVYDQRVLVGTSRYARVIWNPNTTTSFVYAGRSGSDIIILGVSDGKSDSVYCMRSSVTQIITSPVGCSEYNNYLCSNFDGLNRQRLLDNWAVSVAACTSPGDCFGPLYEPGFLLSGIGPNCSIPAVTWPKFPPAELRIIDSDCGVFSGNLTFTLNTRAGFRNSDASIYYDSGTLGVLFMRNLSDTNLNSILLIRAVGSPYTVIYESSLNHPHMFALPNLEFRNISNHAQTCTVGMLEITAQDTSTLLDPDLVTDLTYSVQPEIPWYYFTRACNFYVNRYSNIRETTATYFPVNIPIGGRVIFKYTVTPEEIPLIPFRVEPQSGFEHYLSGCEHFYPKSSVFQGLSGVEYNRAEPVLYSCYAPFINLDLIGLVDDSKRKFESCFRLGGTVNGITEDACVKTQTLQYCKKNWYYYDNYCYYKFPPSARFSNQKSSLQEAEDVCQAVGGTSFFALRADIVAWILDRYLWYTPINIKVRVNIDGNRCNCFHLVNLQEVSESCDCNILEFPLCRYAVKDHPLVFRDFAMSPETMTILRDGQDGLAYDGRPLKCYCNAGSTGPYCTEQTCIAPIDLEAATLEESLRNPLLRFFNKCYKHGHCVDFRPWNCACNPGYGPPSSLKNASDPHQDHPCACPAVYIAGNQYDYQIDDQRYPNNEFGICNNYRAGYCDLADTQVCKSITVTDVNPDSLTERMPVWQGKALTCKVPILMPGSGGQIQKGFCNGQGTCCPSGERLDEQVLSTSLTDLLNREECQSLFVGCVCDNGYDGEACTSIAPGYLVRSRLNAEGYIRLPYLINVTRVTGLDAFEIRVKLEIECPGCTVGLYLINKGEATSSYIEVYNEEFPICGYNAHLYMNRFFANAVWRSCGTALVENSFEYARLGSTLTDCQCDVNYSGTRCGLGVSAVRFELGDWKRYTCGTNLLPQRGFDTQDQCQCNKEFGFEGTACQCRHGCGKYGVCRTPKFRFGQCQYDLTASTAFASQEAATTLNQAKFYQFVIDSADGVVLFLRDYGYWFFEYGSIVSFESYAASSISITSDFGLIPLTLNYSCQSAFVLAYPQKVTGYALGLSDATTAIYLNLTNSWYPSCNVSVVRVYPCVSRVLEWSSIAEALDTVLDEKVYTDVSFASTFSAYRVDDVNPETQFGKFDCNNVVDRLIESALMCLGRVVVPQCNHYMYNSSLGEAYGLFWNRHDFIKFETEPEEWGDAQYRLLGSFLKRNWTDTSWDEYFNALVLRLLEESQVTIIQTNTTVTDIGSNTSTGGSIYATGYDGNFYRRLSNLTHRRISGLPGNWISLGQGITELQQITITVVPVANISQVAIIAPNGKICGGYFGNVTLGTSLTLRCELGNLPESEGESLYRALNAGELALYLNQTWEDWTLWFATTSSMSVPWTIQTEYTVFQVSDVWNKLKTSIMLDGVFPYATAENNLTRAEIADRYRVYLSPRKCTHHYQCRAFGKAPDLLSPDQYKCVFRTDAYTRLWLNGQDLPPVIALGDEGGCDCRGHPGIWETTSHCILCKNGYGPLTDEDWNRYTESGLNQGLSSRPADCTIPVATNGYMCAGNGFANYTEITTTNVTYRVWTSDTDPQLRIVPRCQTVEWGLELQETSHPDVMIYGDNSEIVILFGAHVYQNGVERSSVHCDLDNFHKIAGSAYSSTEWYVESRSIYSYWLVPVT